MFKNDSAQKTNFKWLKASPAIIYMNPGSDIGTQETWSEFA